MVYGYYSMDNLSVCAKAEVTIRNDIIVFSNVSEDVLQDAMETWQYSVKNRVPMVFTDIIIIDERTSRLKKFANYLIAKVQK